jgi:acid stress-induced BolA-like protein IbaG/YrbA
MEPLIDQLKIFLGRSLPGAEVALEDDRPPEKIGGLLVWSGFEGRDQLERQRMVRQLIRDNFTADEQARVSFIVTLTPEENEIMKSN